MSNQEVKDYLDKAYTPGFITDIESEAFLPGLSEDVVRAISAKKNEPEFILKFRLQAYRHWLTCKSPLGRMCITLKLILMRLFIILRLK